MTAVLRLESLPLLSPLQGYDRAEWRRRQLSDRFRAKVVSYYRFLAVRSRSGEDARLDGEFRRCADETVICEAYRELVMSAGVEQVDPASPRFIEDLGEFHQNYIRNFPVPSDQESFDSFRDLLSAPGREDGYRELCYSVKCPLTGQYLIGANFVVQPESNSAFPIYGFVNPAARGIGGFARCLVGLVREKSRLAIAAHFSRHPERRPSYYDSAGPLVLFEKNVIDDMSLPDILMDSAGIDVDRPPTAGTCPLSWGIGQRTRDLVWHRCGARVLDFHYFQPSLQGVARVKARDRKSVIAYLNGASLADRSRVRAENALKSGLADKNPGCGALSLCTCPTPINRVFPWISFAPRSKASKAAVWSRIRAV